MNAYRTLMTDTRSLAFHERQLAVRKGMRFLSWSRRSRSVFHPCQSVANLLRGIAIAALLLVIGSAAFAQPPDTLTIATGADHSGRQRLTGRVVDFAGEVLTWENVAGTQTEIAADRVVEIEANWNDDHRAADRFFDSGEYAAALNMYAKAIGPESRLWVRRLILSRAVWCCRNTNQTHRAVQTFVALVKSDPATPYFECIPLAWTPTAADAQLTATATAALALDQPAAAQLVGASWLVSGGEGVKAAETLRRLTTHADRRIAVMAETQLWRTNLGGSIADSADRFGDTTARLPFELQAGPAILWGDALTAAGRNEEAALAYLRVPVLHPLAGDLAPEAWYRAAKALAADGRREEALLALRSLMAEHPNSPLAPAARQRLELMQP